LNSFYLCKTSERPQGIPEGVHHGAVALDVAQPLEERASVGVSRPPEQHDGDLSVVRVAAREQWCEEVDERRRVAFSEATREGERSGTTQVGRRRRLEQPGEDRPRAGIGHGAEEQDGAPPDESDLTLVARDGREVSHRVLARALDGREGRGLVDGEEQRAQDWGHRTLVVRHVGSVLRASAAGRDDDRRRCGDGDDETEKRGLVARHRP
jgi:hypothetical protein